jgi:hypothetical protein
MKLLHVVAGPISKPMAHIWNLSVAQGIFPDMWKISKSIPILKSGDSNDPLNYRIVSLINQFSKIFERIAFKRLNDFLEMNNFFSKNQFGFRKGISTAHCILSIINSISKSLNDNQLVLCVLLDIAKCFDSVNHSILLAKLNRYGIRGLANDWFRSYFSNRKQRVYVNGTPSDILCSICLGILQGSILGVILFTIFINDIGRACRELIAKLFADDCTGLISAKNLTELIPLANQELDRLLNWYNANKLLINAKKTKALLFGPPRTNLDLEKTSSGHTIFPVFLNFNSPGESNITKIVNLNLIPNPDETSAKLLGVLIDSKLNLKSHMKFVHSKVARANYTLAQMRNILDQRHLLLLYNSYLRSNMEYCCLLFVLANQGSIKPILTLQYKAARTICRARYRDSAPPLLKRLKILPINKLIQFNAAKFMFNYRMGLQPGIFNSTWKKNSEIHAHAVRVADDFVLERVHSIYLLKHPLYSFPLIWNSLDRDIKNSVNKNEFTKKLLAKLISEIV